MDLTGQCPGGTAPDQLRPGMVLRVDACASVQFAGARALRLRLVSVDGRPTYDGWVWLTGYVLDRRGQATAKREIYVRRAGLHLGSPPTPVQARRPAAARAQA